MARRVSDLTLLRISPQYFQKMTQSVFQPILGVKQDRLGHQNPLVVLKRYETDLRLCPVAHLDEYLVRTESKGRPLNSVTPHSPMCVVHVWTQHLLTETRSFKIFILLKLRFQCMALFKHGLT
jgi:hypothetical protein